MLSFVVIEQTWAAPFNSLIPFDILLGKLKVRTLFINAITSLLNKYRNSTNLFEFV